MLYSTGPQMRLDIAPLHLLPIASEPAAVEATAGGCVFCQPRLSSSWYFEAVMLGQLNSTLSMCGGGLWHKGALATAVLCFGVL